MAYCFQYQESGGEKRSDVRLPIFNSFAARAIIVLNQKKILDMKNDWWVYELYFLRYYSSVKAKIQLIWSLQLQHCFTGISYVSCTFHNNLIKRVSLHFVALANGLHILCWVKGENNRAFCFDIEPTAQYLHETL